MVNIFYLIVFLVLDLVLVAFWFIEYKKNYNKPIKKEYTVEEIYTDFLFVKSVLDTNEKNHKVDTETLFNLIELFDKKHPEQDCDKCSMYLWHYIFEDTDVLRQLAHRMDMRGDAYKWKYDEEQQMNVPVKIK